MNSSKLTKWQSETDMFKIIINQSEHSLRSRDTRQPMSVQYFSFQPMSVQYSPTCGDQGA